ncbi:MAG: ABC transporter permease subunit [Puniceicoccales bacterium]|nr:ABC transporter permease subunit [Puniceicoccales bacterium]
MESIAGERASGDLDSLLRTAIHPAAIVFCKFLALLLGCLSLWLLAMAMHPLVFRFAFSPNLFVRFSGAGMCRSIAFLATVHALLCSLALFIGAAVSNSFRAAAVTAAAQLLYFFGPRLLHDFAASQPGSPLRNFILRLDVFSFLGEWSSATVDSRPIVFHLSVCACFLCATAAILHRP